MMQTIPCYSTTCRGIVTRRLGKSLLLLPAISCVMAVSSCEGGSVLPRLEITADTRPIGEGLKVIGFALVGATVIVVIGKLLK